MLDIEKVFSSHEIIQLKESESFKTEKESEKRTKQKKSEVN